MVTGDWLGWRPAAFTGLIDEIALFVDRLFDLHVRILPQ